MGRLLLLFVVVPAVELALLIEIGGRIGTAATLALIVGTGMLGAALARQQGVSVVRRMQGEVSAGRLPTGALLDGVLILVAGAFLVTPGVLTDAVGLALLTPGVRSLVKRSVRARLERAIREGQVQVDLAYAGFESRPPGPGPELVKSREEPAVTRVIERNGRRFLEYLSVLRNADDLTDAIGECMQEGARGVLVEAERLPDAFFDLRTGVAGAVLQKLQNYRIRLAAVLPRERSQHGRFGEMVSEANRGSHFRVFEDREAAEVWLSS